MSHNHAHSHAAATSRLPIATALTLCFVIAEAIAGYFANSLALVSDAGHNLSDALALGFSAFAVWIARRPSTRKRTFGYHRVSVLAALTNALSLVAIGAVIIWEGLRHLMQPVAVHGGMMIVVASCAIVLNLVIGYWLHGGRHDLNIRSAYLHMMGDAVAAAGVVVAGLIAKFTGALWADPAVSLLIGILIIWSAWSIMRESISILLESTPRGIDMAQVESAICATPGVLGMHDLHVWTISSGMIACSLHVVVANQSIRDGQEVLKSVVVTLRTQFHINHATVQVEVEGCETEDMYCQLTSHGEDHAH